jgi:hypothetical protein
MAALTYIEIDYPLQMTAPELAALIAELEEKYGTNHAAE